MSLKKRLKRVLWTDWRGKERCETAELELEEEKLDKEIEELKEKKKKLLEKKENEENDDEGEEEGSCKDKETKAEIKDIDGEGETSTKNIYLLQLLLKIF